MLHPLVVRRSGRGDTPQEQGCEDLAARSCLRLPLTSESFGRAGAPIHRCRASAAPRRSTSGAQAIPRCTGAACSGLPRRGSAHRGANELESLFARGLCGYRCRKSWWYATEDRRLRSLHVLRGALRRGSSRRSQGAPPAGATVEACGDERAEQPAQRDRLSRPTP